MKSSRSDAFGRFVSLSISLNEDIRLIGDSLSVLDGAPQQSMRRAYVRAVFARIEASVFALKQLTLDRAATDELNLGERLLLEETSYRLNKQGEIKVSPVYSSLRDSLRFTLPLLCRVLQIDYKFDFSGGWNALPSSVNVRNRITHPKESVELNVSDREIESVNAVLKWFDTQWCEIGRLHKELAFQRMREDGATEKDIAALDAQSSNLH